MKEETAKWTGWKAILKTVCFLLLLALALGRVNEILALKSYDGLYTMQQFYKQPKDTVDLLVLGSSHAYVNIDPGILWEEYGVPAYDLGGGVQPLWNTYFYLKEALKTQTPKLIVLDAYTVTFNQEYNDNGRAVSNTFGMKWSRDKVNAMKLSAPPDKLSSFLLGYTQYHSRIRELSREDFLKDKGDEARYASWKGSYLSTAVRSFAWPKDVQTEERGLMTEKTEAWYRKTIELAQSANVPLLIVVNPYFNITTEHQAIYNTAADIAAEYGVPFVNFNRNFTILELDPAVSYFDEEHMNIWGSREFTRMLGKMLTEDYNLPDHRGDSVYQSWEDNAQYIAAYARDGRLTQGVTPEEAASLLLNPDYTCAVSVSGNGGTFFASLLEALGVPAGETGAWLVCNGEILWAAETGESEVYFPLDQHDLKVSQDEMVFDRGMVQTVLNGISIFVYDSVTQAQAAYLVFDVVTYA